MKKTLILASAVAMIFSCSKEEEAPSYTPGRLTRIYIPEHEDLSPTTYEYQENKVIRTLFRSDKGDKSKYYFESGLLAKVINIHDDQISGNYFATDSLVYDYQSSYIREIASFHNGSTDTTYYYLNSGKVEYSIVRKEGYFFNENVDYDSCSFTWSEDNLTKFEVFRVKGGDATNFQSIIFEYSNMNNPLFYSNIPKISKTFSDITRGASFWEFTPNCSKLCPNSVTVYSNGTEILKRWYDFKTFADNVPYQVKYSISMNEEYAGYGTEAFEYEGK